MTLQLHSYILPGRTMREWHMIVGNVVEEMNFILGQH
jgi:hypothetical protein